MKKDHNISVISHESVMCLLSLAQRHAEQLNVAIVAVVMDVTGRVRGKLAMDGASIIADDVALQKARAALLGLAPEALAVAMSEQPLMAQSLMIGGNISYLPGAKAIKNGQGQVIGALAIGGADIDQDVKCLEQTLRDFC